jgi:ATP phosphoribosyltransferase regulatory subunit
MSSAWLLPEHIADVLPAQARQIEELRRALLDMARGYGYELVMPPLLEHLESLLSGTGGSLNLQTFKLVDQLSGRSLGLRADTTPQVARIDAHLLNRRGVTRLCYCGPVLHTRPAALHATREPLQFGAELYGHAGLEAEREALDLALDCLRAAGLDDLVLDLADARVLGGLLDGVAIPPARLEALVTALAAKDGGELKRLSEGLPADVAAALQTLPSLYGDEEVLAAARRLLPARPGVHAALDDLATLAASLRAGGRRLSVGFDLSDLGGYAYYSGVRFAVYGRAANEALLRGGRYDEVGAVFGRKRPAVGFSLDLKVLTEATPARPLRAAVRAPWGDDDGLRQAVQALRQAGETVVCMLPGHEDEGQEFDCDRELVADAGRWVVRAV